MGEGGGARWMGSASSPAQLARRSPYPPQPARVTAAPRPYFWDFRKRYSVVRNGAPGIEYSLAWKSPEHVRTTALGDAPRGPETKKAATPGGGRAAAETVTASAVSPAHSRGAPLRGSSHAPRLEALAPRLGHAGSIESRNMCGQVSALGGLPHHLDPLSCVLPADSTNSSARPPQ